MSDPDSFSSSGPSSGRKTWLIVGVAAFALLAAAGTGIGAYFSYANQVPPYRPPVVVMPPVNAYNDFVAAGAMLPRQQERPPKNPQDWKTSALRKAVAANRKALQRMRQGMGREYQNPPMFSFQHLLPELADFRTLGQALIAEGQLAEREGRFADAARSYRDCLELGNDIPRGGCLIHGLLGIALQEMGLEAINGVAGRLDGPTSAKLAREMEALDRRAVSYQQALAEERDFGIAGIHEVLRERDPGIALANLSSGSDGAGMGLMEQVAFRVTPRRAMVDGYAKYMEGLVTEAGKPYWQPAVEPPLPADPVGRMLAPAVLAARMKWAYRDVQWRLTQLRLAALAHERETGRTAPSAGLLIPRYLKSIPQDPFAAQPLLYRVHDGKPLLYSRGPDGDDDRGDHLGKNLQPDSTGDITWVGPLPRGKGR